MTLLHQAAQKAVEALIYARRSLAPYGGSTEKIDAAHAALESALQEVPREPVADFDQEYVHAYLQEALTDTVGGAVDPEVQRFMTWLAASPSTTRQQEVGSGWISVYDRRPEVGTECLVWAHPRWSKGPHVALDTWDEQRECPVAWSTASIPIGDGWDSHEFEEVSHWMPIPAAPSTPENADGGPHG